MASFDKAFYKRLSSVNSAAFGNNDRARAIEGCDKFFDGAGLVEYENRLHGLSQAARILHNFFRICLRISKISFHHAADLLACVRAILCSKAASQQIHGAYKCITGLSPALFKILCQRYAIGKFVF